MLALVGGAPLPDSSIIDISPGGTLLLGGSDRSIAALRGAGSILLESGHLTFGANGAVTSFSGNIGGAGGGLTKTGPGEATLTGSLFFGGGLAVSGGRLVLTRSNTF